MIHVHEATKRYPGSQRAAVDHVSFDLKPGEIVGFLGPNGAGKSTLLRAMSTYLPLSSGTIEIAGHDVRKHPLQVRQSLGYLTEHNALYDEMLVGKFLSFIGRTHGLSSSRLAERLDWVLNACSLREVRNDPISECSKGFRQRIGLGAALIHDPPVLLLDEPTHGLDPLQVRAFRDFLREIREGRAILFSSHILSEVVEISDRLVMLRAGRLCCDMSVEALKNDAAQADCDLETHLLENVLQDAATGAAAEPEA